MKRKACIILPTYNEAENIEIVVRRIFEQQKKSQLMIYVSL